MQYSTEPMLRAVQYLLSPSHEVHGQAASVLITNQPDSCILRGRIGVVLGCMVALQMQTELRT